MAETKKLRNSKQQLGQFMTPSVLAERIVKELPLTSNVKVLEPSFGTGAFLVPLIDRFMRFHEGTVEERLRNVLQRNVYGVEIDPTLHTATLNAISVRYGCVLPEEHNLTLGDFFRAPLQAGSFHIIVGNPPFGGTFDGEIETKLDHLYGKWAGVNVKKETYSFFIAKSLDLLTRDGELCFISSDTFLTIKTMEGLRRRLMDQSDVTIETISRFSGETEQPTVILHARKPNNAGVVTINGSKVNRTLIEKTANFSWKVTETLGQYFEGPTLSKYITATSGMTIGKNELFVREIANNEIVEPYHFEFYNKPVTLKDELAHAKLNQLSASKTSKVITQETAGVTRRDVKITPRRVPVKIALPDARYKYYNKPNNGVVFTPPRWVVMWEDDGDAVRTFKKNNNWYLRGVGGQPFFERPGLTWQLVAPRLKVKFLPNGYILDSGAPCAFLKEGVPEEEFWFIFAWLLTPTANRILKTVINHTRNIQSKDVERLPYPWWVPPKAREHVCDMVQTMVINAILGKVTFSYGSTEMIELDAMFALPKSN